jgi:HipA-like protein
MKSKTLNIFLNTVFVGELKKATSGEIAFQYDEEWIQNGFEISRSLPMREERYKGDGSTPYFSDTSYLNRLHKSFLTM